MLKTRQINECDDFVYDISLDGTVVNALGLNVMSNTDGFNFQLPDTYRYTEDNPYIGKGLNRNVKEGEKYTGLQADVAEFNDLYMRRFMGLGIDEVVESTINFSRKNYADYFPEKSYPEDVKKVGNTIKSKKMPEYIAKFLDKGIRLLLQKKGSEFLDEYYAYIEKIYNYAIPLKDIASKGKVKKTVADYKEDCNTLTKAGRPKSRQAHMELAIKEGIKVDMGDTLYYINIGKSKSQSDVKKVVHYYVTVDDLFGSAKKDMRSTYEREFKKFKQENTPSVDYTLNDYVKQHHPEAVQEEEIILNAVLLPNDVIDSDEDVFCEDNMEYNVPKYIDQFNKRITALLVCFPKIIRDRILITNPADRPIFTEEEMKLSSGEPNKPSDQDTYEELMTMEDKEIRFWMAHPEFEIPFVKECDIDWEETKNEYLTRMEREKELGINTIREKYAEIVGKLTMTEFEAFENDGKLPASLTKIISVDPATGHFVAKQFPDVVIGTVNDFLDSVIYKDADYEEE